MSNLMNKIGINDKNGNTIRLGDKLRVSSNDFEGKLVLNEEGIVYFDEIKNLFYLQKEHGQILLSEKYKYNYTVISRSDMEVKSFSFVVKLFILCFSLLLITMFLLYNL